MNRGRVANVWVTVAVSGLGGSLAGCASPGADGFHESEPGARIDAAIEASRKMDPSAVPELIEMLDSDDPAARLVAINALGRLTGETHGYDHAAPEDERREAVARWQGWYRAYSSSGARPEGAPSGASGRPGAAGSTR
ncbi:MAG: HEAT repeat domain-containing protein [Phycisphaerae bacterium]|nr:HEAT repeat domain-containing protein [Phycisphaerae bacterium]